MPIRSVLVVAGLSVLVALVPASALSQTTAAAGRVKVSSGTVAIVRNGQALPAPLGAEVFEGDALRTGADGRLAVMLRDETRVSLGPDSELALAAFAFAPSESRLGVTIQLARGVIAYVSGLVAKLAPASVTIQTPTSIIGVRGTHALVRVGTP
jgi:hypothetical protein